MTKSYFIKSLIVYSAIISCVFSFADTLQNGGNFGFSFGVTLFTLVPYAILYFWAAPPSESVAEFYVVLISCVLVCSVGIVIYGLYFLGGPSTQANSAGQMHVVFIPSLHIALTVATIFFAIIIEKLVDLIKHVREKHNNHFHSTQKDARVK
jgi:hypothetical protein